MTKMVGRLPGAGSVTRFASFASAPVSERWKRRASKRTCISLQKCRCIIGTSLYFLDYIPAMYSDKVQGIRKSKRKTNKHIFPWCNTNNTPWFKLRWGWYAPLCVHVRRSSTTHHISPHAAFHPSPPKCALSKFFCGESCLWSRERCFILLFYSH